MLGPSRAFHLVMTTKLHPTSNNLLIDVHKADERSKGGIVIPDRAKDVPHQGTVIAAGPGYFTERGVFIETTCKVGQHIIYANTAGVEVTVDGRDYIFLSEDAVLGVIEEA